VSDDRRSAPATVTLNVANVNDAPAGVTDAYTLVEDDTLVVDAPGVLANDTDADGDTLTATVVVGPTDGGLVLSANGSFSYVPAPDTSGERSFTYRAGDGTAQSAPVSVALTILPANDPPRLREDVTQTLEDTSVVVDVLGNDDDPDGEIDASTVEIARSATQGTATVEAEGTLLYTPDRNATGADSLQYVVSDTEGATSDPAWVRVTIVPVNDPPVAVTDTAATPEATPVTIPVLANDRDPDGDALTVVGWTEPRHGTVTAPGDTALVYTPAGDFFGPDSLRYTVRDPAGTTAQAVVRVQVTFVDDPPVAVADTLSTPQNVALVLDLTANDVDPERGPLRVVSTGEPSLGTVTQVSDTLWVYQPEPDVSGTDAFPYVVRDEGGQTASAEVVVSVSACAYAITDLGTLGGTASRAFDVAETGAVVGLAETATGDVRAFVWQEESTRALASEGPSQALAIHGTTVVGTQQVSEGLAAVRWSLDAPDAPGVALSDSFSVAFGVHGGTVVGARKDGARFRAVQWDGGTETLLDTPSGAESQATAVDASGTAIGFAVQDGVPTALRWSTPDAPDVLGTGRAFGVGAAGSVVGQSNGVATRWAEDGTSTALADPGPATLAYGSNDAGTVVGGMWASASAARKAAPWAGPWSSDLRAQLRPPGVGEEAAPKAEATSAFVWQAGVLTNLESCLAADAGWTLVEARAINNAGQIVGFGLRDGTPRGYLLTPVNNQAPEAVADLSRLLGGVETVIDVLANDRDADGDALRVASVGPAAVGTVALRDDGQVVYQAPPTYQGSDRFAYVVDDGSGGAARGTVTIDVAPRPSGLVLGAGAPNPFRDRATFEYVLPEAARVQLEVFNVLGQRVARVLDAEKPAGIHTATVDARALASGLYFFRLSTPYGIQVQRLSLVR
jgi:probable HAF family extracellular repeat protein